MKSLLAIIVVIKAIYNIRFYVIAKEKFIYFKCITYLFISSITLLILNFPVPLGAFIMACFSLFDSKNRKLKMRMIVSGLIIIFFSIIDFQYLTSPFQKAYIYFSTQSIEKIDLYSYNNNQENYLLSITDPTELSNWAEQIRMSKPSSSWNHKKSSANLGYKIVLHNTQKTIELRTSPYGIGGSNIFIGNQFIPYENASIISYINTMYSNTPISLTIDFSQNDSISIYNKNILNTLWRTILWDDTVTTQSLSTDDFIISSHLFFDKYLGRNLTFASDFKYAMIDRKKIIQLPDYLQTMLREQYVLSQLDPVNELTHFEPAHASNPEDSSLKFFIQQDSNQMYYGLYLQDYKLDETILLHSVHSPNAEFFILKHPYILLLDKKSPSSHSLMLVNQNLPEKHRYIVKDEQIISRSISLCPQNTKFTYIVDYGDSSILYLVSDYYRSPKIITTGQVMDSLFLSDNYLAFTQIIDNKSFLCIYSLSHQQVIKYINIPGDITLTEASNNQLTFSVQSVEGLELKEAIFYLDDNLNIYKKKRP